MQTNENVAILFVRIHVHKKSSLLGEIISLTYSKQNLEVFGPLAILRQTRRIKKDLGTVLLAFYFLLKLLDISWAIHV